MNVIKRNGNIEELSYDKIVTRLKQLAPELNIQYASLVTKVVDQLYDNIPTKKIDELMAEICAALGSNHYDYSKLSSLICISNHQKEVNHSILSCVLKVKPGYLYYESFS
jgi:hypothetical protein